jgi:hypothetical protein
MTPASAGNATGKYFEAAPADLSTSADMAWCSDTANALSNTGTAIGTGALNTSTMLSTCTSGAGFSADAYSPTVASILYSDWFLPSKDELNQLCKYARQQTYSAPTTACTNTGTLRSGFARSGFAEDYYWYWSSSEESATGAWAQSFDDGNKDNSNKIDLSYVRPVRAFNP